MRLESGTCNVCSAPCSSCMHLNHALMGSKAEEFSDDNCREGEANSQNSMNEGNVHSLSSRACENLQHTVSETSNMLSVDSSRDSLSENAESRQNLLNKYQDPKHLEGHDDNTSCISRASDANLVNDRDQRNADRKSIPSRDCSSSLTKESAPVVISGEEIAANKDNLIDSTSNVSLKVCPKSQVDSDNDLCDAKVGEDCKCSVHDGHHEKAEEPIKSPDKQESQSENESDESDVVEHDVKVCDICGDAGREDLLAICCRCTDGAEHTYCMREMVETLPEGDWFCEECQDAVEAENKRLDAEEKKIIKTASTSQVSGKRLSDNIEVVPPAAKRQALELSKGSPKASSPRKLVPLSRESSFKSIDKLKGKSGLSMPLRNHSGGDDMEAARTPSTGHRGQVSKSILLKSNSSNNFNSKPRVKLDDVFPSRPKGSSEQSSKNTETSARMTSKSTLFKSSSLGRSSAIEPKVKMLSPKSATTQDLKGSRHLKESGTFDRKFMSRNDRPVASSVASTPKGDQKLTPRGETIIKPSAVNNRELKINQDGKLSASSKSVNNISRKSLDQERTSTSNDEALQDTLPRSRETASQVEKSRESLGDHVRPVVPTASKNPFCQKCEEFGHSVESCTVGPLQESAAEISVTASSISKEEMQKGSKLKAALQAALRKKPEIYRKKEVSSQTDEISTSGSELNCEAPSRDQVLVSNTLKNSISTEETHEQQEVLENSTSDSSKCSSASDLQQLNSCSTDLSSQLGKSDLVSLNAQKPLMRDMSKKSLAISSVFSKMLAFPEYEHIWQGVFEVHRNGKPPELCTGVQAHLSSSASPKVLEAVAKFSPEVSLNEVSRLSTWPSQFHHGGAREDNIALYFFARDVESYERHYRRLLDHMIRNDLALKGIFDGVELLIFPSNQLPENSQRWNMLFFLWGVFRGRRINHSDSAKNICIPSLNAMPVDENSSDAVVTLSERYLSKCIDEKSINCDKACNALPTSNFINQTPITVSRNTDINPQTHLCSQQVSLPDRRNDSKYTSEVPKSCNDLCQQTKSTGSSLKASELEDEWCRESKHPEDMGTTVSNKMVEAKTDSVISDKQKNTTCWEIPSVSNQEKDAASNISKNEISERMNCDKDQQRTKKKQKEDCYYIDLEETIDNHETQAASNIGKDKTSERMVVDEDQQRPKRKQRDGHYIVDLEATVENQGTGAAIDINKDRISEKMEGDEDQQRFKRKTKEDYPYIDLEAPLQEDLSTEEVEYKLPNDKEVHRVDLSAVGCQKMPLNEVNGKSEDGESSRKKLRTSLGGIYGHYSSVGIDSFNGSLTSLGNDLGSSSSVEDKGCDGASNEKIIREDLGTMERTFFPVDTQNINGSQLELNTMPLKGICERKGVIPNLNLALGDEMNPPSPPSPQPAVPKGIPPFLVGAVDKKNNRADRLADGQEDDVAAASLSLSLSFPSSNKEHTKTSPKAELLPDGGRVKPSFLLFGRYTDQ